MRPGDRKARWRSGHNGDALIFVALASGSLFGVDGTPGIVMAGFFLLMAYLEARNARVGWRLKTGRPPWAGRLEAIERKHQRRRPSA